MKCRVLLKRTLAFVLVILLSFSMLVACSKSSDETKPQENQAAQNAAQQDSSKQEVIELRYMSPDTQASPWYDLLMTFIDDYNKNNPNVKISHEALPSKELRTKLTVEMAAGSPPNVFWCIQSYAREFAKDNKVIDWAPIFKSDEKLKERFPQKVVDAATDEQGRVLAAPWQINLGVLFYNTEIFKKYNLEYPKTWEELMNVVKILRQNGVNPMVTGGKDLRFAWFVAQLQARTGGIKAIQELSLNPDKMTEWDNPEYGFPQAMEKFEELVKAKAFPEGLNGISDPEAKEIFARGDAAMFYEGNFLLPHFEKLGGREFIDKIDFGPFPVMNDQKGDQDAWIGGPTSGLSLARTNDKAVDDAAIAFGKAYLLADYNRQRIEQGGFIYGGKVDFDRAKLDKVTLKLIDTYMNEVEKTIPSMDVIAPPAVDLAIKKTAMPGIISGEFTVEQAVEEVKKAAEEFVKSMK